MSDTNLYIALLHDDMVDKRGRVVTTSVTLMDVHDIARSAKTYGAKGYFIAHTIPTLRDLVHQLTDHWETGFGKEYNPNRVDALSLIHVVTSPDEAKAKIKEIHGTDPILVATSGRSGVNRVTFPKIKESISSGHPHLLMFGTGYGMCDELLSKADYIIEPIYGPTPYNFLSVRSAVAVVLDRLVGR